MKDKEKICYARVEFNSEIISAEDKLFCILLVAGYSANRAYLIAYNSNADINSAAAMASRKVNSWEIQQVLRQFKFLYDNNMVDFPTKSIKNI